MVDFLILALILLVIIFFIILAFITKGAKTCGNCGASMYSPLIGGKKRDGFTDYTFINV